MGSSYTKIENHSPYVIHILKEELQTNFGEATIIPVKEYILKKYNDRELCFFQVPSQYKNSKEFYIKIIQNYYDPDKPDHYSFKINIDGSTLYNNGDDHGNYLYVGLNGTKLREKKIQLKKGQLIVRWDENKGLCDIALDYEK